MTAHGSTYRRGYGWRHQQARARAKRIVDAGQGYCARCGRWINPMTTPWELDHADDRSHYIGVSCRRRNRAAAQRKRESQPAPAVLAFFGPKAS